MASWLVEVELEQWSGSGRTKLKRSATGMQLAILVSKSDACCQVLTL